MQKNTLTSMMNSILLFSLVTAPAFAAEEGGFIGIGVGYSPDYEGSDDYEAVPAVFGKYTYSSGRYVELGGTQEAGRAARLSVNLITEHTSTIWKFGPILQYRLERDGVDNNQVDRMEKVDGAAEAGLFVAVNSGPWGANLAAAADISDEHEGTVVDLSGSRRFTVNDKLDLTLGASVSWASSDYMDTYFGVSANDSARSGLPQYDADDGFKDVGLSLNANYQFNDKWGMLAGVSWFKLIGDADDDSPVTDVGDENQYGAVLAVTYSF